MKKENAGNVKEVRAQAQGLRHTCLVILQNRDRTVPDVRITGFATRILDAAKAITPDNELLQSLEIQQGGWAMILAVINAVLEALPFNP